MAEGTAGKILARLGEWEEKEGSLPRLLEFYRDLLNIQSKAGARICVPQLSLSGEVITSRLKSGAVLSGFDDLLVDWPLLQSIFEDIAVLVAGYSEALGKAAENIRSLGSYPGNLKEISRAWFEGSRLAHGLPADVVNEDLLEFMIGAALRPCLNSYCEQLIKLVDQKQWRRGYCPVCAGSPDFAFLDSESGARWLLCSRCDAEWLFQRLECPYCGTQDQNALVYLTDEEGRYRLYTCEKCRRYLKAIDLRQADYEVLLPLERFLTFDIDKQAHQNGYTLFKPGVGRAGR